MRDRSARTDGCEMCASSHEKPVLGLEHSRRTMCPPRATEAVLVIMTWSPASAENRSHGISTTTSLAGCGAHAPANSRSGPSASAVFFHPMGFVLPCIMAEPPRDSQSNAVTQVAQALRERQPMVPAILRCYRCGYASLSAAPHIAAASLAGTPPRLDRAAA